MAGRHGHTLGISFRSFIGKKIHHSSRYFIQSCVFSLMDRFPARTSSKSPEITISIAALRFRDMASSRLLDSVLPPVQQCWITNVRLLI